MTNREDSGSRAAKPDADPTAQQPLGRRLFQFVLVADTHVNERDGHSSSPYAANARANDRARFVFASIAQRDPQPEFVMHLGDIVHPVPELPSFEPAVRRFQSIAAVTRCPLRLLPGNHDVGDKRVEWMPAGTVTAEHVQQYRRLFGDDHYAFEHAGCRFFALNAQLINSGLPAEAEQRAWLERELAAAAGKRLFVCIHYPPYVTDRNEPGSYDNIDEPGRSWLLELIERHSVEALFAGHVHNFWYDRIGHCQMYLLPATSFLRHDYTEFYRVEPLREHGRDDTGKFGYFVVDVFERGHVAHCVRTGGRELAAGEELPPPTPGLPPVHSRTNVDAPVGVDLRHPWAELVEIAATGGVQEFERKRARNDYPLLALWEMGVRRLRVPLQDLLDPRVRDRMRILREIGHEFLVYGYGVPGSDAQRAAADTRGLVDAFEVVLPGARIAEAMPALARLREATAARVYVSKLRMHEDAKFDGLRFHHFINHGFVAAEHEQLLQLSDAARGRAAFDGFVFRVGCGDAPWDALPRCAALAAELGFGAVAHVRLAGESPADARADDRANGWRVAETLLTAFALPQIRAYFDTFMDVDRGYFPRNGFIDRRYDPRPASRIYA
ncbi:MAG TPA: metallophosphoesterase, partial [Burkholderiaceae bacterium]|nr:metallophosphoesterase [Burkholderiaceae bacterium]